MDGANACANTGNYHLDVVTAMPQLESRQAGVYQVQIEGMTLEIDHAAADEIVDNWRFENQESLDIGSTGNLGALLSRLARAFRYSA